MKKHCLIVPLFSLSLALTGSLNAQVALTSSLSYTQDFDKSAFTADMESAGTGNPLLWKKSDSTPSGTTSTAWSNNSTFTGWVRQVSVGGQTNRADKDFIGEMKGGTTRFGAGGDGGSYGIDYAGGDQSETALGVVMQGTGAEVSFGVVFDVDAGLSVTGASISYTGEQWFRGTTTHTMNFQYKVLDTFSNFRINDETGWTDADALDFSSVNVGTSVAKINGNNATNQSAKNASSSLEAEDSQYVAFRWKYDSIANGAQSGLFVDDFSVDFTTVAVPEPSTYAIFAGILAFAARLYQRRR